MLNNINVSIQMSLFMNQMYDLCLNPESRKSLKQIFALCPYYIYADNRLFAEKKDELYKTHVRLQKCFDSFQEPEDTLEVTVRNHVFSE